MMSEVTTIHSPLGKIEVKVKQILRRRYYAGSWNQGESKDEIDHEDPSKVELGGGFYYCFSFANEVSMTLDYKGEKVKFKSQVVDTSPTYYPGGKMFNYEEAKKEISAKHLRTMEKEKHPYVIVTRLGAINGVTWPSDKGDKVLPDCK